MYYISIDHIRNKINITDTDPSNSSIVYKGSWMWNSEPVAIKEFTESTEHLFDDEVKIMSSLDHPYVMKLYGVISDGDMPAIVMDYMPNGNLHDYLKKVPAWDDGSIIKMARRIGKGLSYLHENDILHLDLKTKNILIDSENKPKICDFGYSVNLGYCRTYLSDDQLGTPRWFTPEALESVTRDGGDDTYEYSRKTDIYTYALIIWCLYSQRKPYHSTNDYQDINTKISNGKHEDETEITQPAVEALCLRAWSLTPKNRPNVDEFLSTFKRLKR